LLYGLNDTEVDFPGDKWIYDLFEDQVRRLPDHAAVTCGNSQLSYKGLAERADNLAGQLIETGVGPGSVVPVLLAPSVDMLIAIFGILQAQGAYLPIDPESPHTRIQFQLKDSKSEVVVTDKDREDKIGTDVKMIDILDDTLYRKSQKDHKGIGDPEGPVYLIYTSGTTGQPKGVLIKNKNLINYSWWLSRTIDLTPEDRSVLISSFAFDLGNTAIFPGILNGGEVHMVQRDIYLSSEALLNYLERNKITYIKVTPSHFNLLIRTPGFSSEKCRYLRLIILGRRIYKGQ